MDTRRGWGMAALLLVGTVHAAHVSAASNTTDMDELKRIVDKQESLIRQLTEKVAQLEARVGGGLTLQPLDQRRVSLEGGELAGLPPDTLQRGFSRSPLEISGYLDMGYVDAEGGGSVSTGALQINSRGDRLADVGLDGDSSFLINNANLRLKAMPFERAEVVTSLDFIPRKLAFTTTGGNALSDTFEVNMAYAAYEPFGEPSALTDSLFGDLKLYAGKFESPFGLEYRVNQSPDRVNISRSMMSIYWTGYPVGVKARGKLLKGPLGEFRDSVLTYTLALTNGEPWISWLADQDRSDNQRRVVQGRLSYGLDLVPGAFFETGVSLANGPRISQGDNRTSANSVGLDGRLEWGPLTLRAEYDYSDLNRARTGLSTATAVKFSHLYAEGFYDIPRPGWWPQGIPLLGLTPYYRYDTRDLNSFPAVGAATTLQEINRHTFALRYILRPGTILKGEYSLVGEAEDASVNDDAFLMSFVQQF